MFKTIVFYCLLFFSAMVWGDTKHAYCNCVPSEAKEDVTCECPRDHALTGQVYFTIPAWGHKDINMHCLPKITTHQIKVSNYAFAKKSDFIWCSDVSSGTIKKITCHNIDSNKDHNLEITKIACEVLAS